MDFIANTGQFLALASESLAGVTGLAWKIMLIPTALAFASGFLNRGQYDFAGLIKPWFIVFVLQSYPIAAGYLINVSHSMVIKGKSQKLITEVKGLSAAMGRATKNPSEALKKLAKEKKELGWSNIGARFRVGMQENMVMLKEAFSFSGFLINAFTTGLTAIIRSTIGLIQHYLLGVLLVVGPLAITFSIIPAMGSLRVQWFSRWLNLSCWSITMNILDEILIGSTTKFKNYIEGQAKSGVSLMDMDSSITQEFIIVNLVIVVLYVMVPFITSFYTNAESTGQFLSKAVAATGFMAHQAMGMAAKSASAAQASWAGSSAYSKAYKSTYAETRSNGGSGSEAKTAAKTAGRSARTAARQQAYQSQSGVAGAFKSVQNALVQAERFG